MIKEKYPGAVSSQPTKKTSNGNTGKDGKKSGKGKGEKNGNKKLKIKRSKTYKRIKLTNFSFLFFADAPILGNKFSTTWRPQGDYIHLKVVFTVQENALLVCRLHPHRLLHVGISEINSRDVKAVN